MAGQRIWSFSLLKYSEWGDDIKKIKLATRVGEVLLASAGLGDHCDR